jgi:predicted 2-oxoglutarate/Fe(II)-dependent dioxygenase YbiX
MIISQGRKQFKRSAISNDHFQMMETEYARGIWASFKSRVQTGIQWARIKHSKTFQMTHCTKNHLFKLWLTNVRNEEEFVRHPLEFR